MAVEGANLVLVIVFVFRRKKNYLKHYLLVGYGKKLIFSLPPSRHTTLEQRCMDDEMT